MSTEFTILLVVQIISSFSIIVLVLLQQGKGADMGSAFGSGSAGSLFGATGAANFLSRATKWAAVVFFVATIGLAYLGNLSNSSPDAGIMDGFAPNSSVPTVPAAPSSSVPSGVSGNSVPSSSEAAN
ncbi:preprotein translocase subunit SecG [Orrella marina]|uniref:Protein-export membrane protein SecG n=1 Tax=Orrella marina TaxID=2163011 RepID=A0A2R4XJT3_9BURK|nr:preprotein translocase subunit SecG [Orrella marina]AWB34087.1 preprotein translocase subunit SecG [Orrella marina]